MCSSDLFILFFHNVEKQDEAQIFLDEPFYLKICWMDGTRTGDYRISVSPNVGADPQHPIVLTLNRSTQASYGSQFGSNPNNLLWALVNSKAFLYNY